MYSTMQCNRWGTQYDNEISSIVARSDWSHRTLRVDDMSSEWAGNDALAPLCDLHSGTVWQLGTKAGMQECFKKDNTNCISPYLEGGP